METTETSPVIEKDSNFSALSELLKTTTTLNFLQKGNTRAVNGEEVERKSDITAHANRALLLLIKATLPLDSNTQKYTDTHQELDSFLSDLKDDPNCVNLKTLSEFYVKHLNLSDNHIPFKIPRTDEEFGSQNLNNYQIIYQAALNLQRHYNQTESIAGRKGTQKIMVEEHDDGDNQSVFINVNLFGPKHHYRMKMNMSPEEVEKVEALVFSRVV